MPARRPLIAFCLLLATIVPAWADDATPVRVAAYDVYEQLKPAAREQVLLHLLKDRWEPAARCYLTVEEFAAQEAFVEKVIERVAGGGKLSRDGFLRLLADVEQHERSAIDYLSGEYRAAVYDAFPAQRNELERRLAAWRLVVSRWQQAGALADDHERLIRWLQTATTRIRAGQLAKLPAMPEFGLAKPQLIAKLAPVPSATTSPPLAGPALPPSVRPTAPHVVQKPVTSAALPEANQAATSARPPIISPTAKVPLPRAVAGPTPPAVAPQLPERETKPVRVATRALPPTIAEITKPAVSATPDTQPTAPRRQTTSNLPTNNTPPISVNMPPAARPSTMPAVTPPATVQTAPATTARPTAPPTVTRPLAASPPVAKVPIAREPISNAPVASPEVIRSPVATPPTTNPSVASRPPVNRSVVSPPAASPPVATGPSPSHSTTGEILRSRGGGVQIDLSELTARVAGYNLALGSLTAKLQEERDWTGTDLLAAVDELSELNRRGADLKLYCLLIAADEQNGVGKMHPPDAAVVLLGGKIFSLRARLQEAVYEGTAEQKQAELTLLDKLSLRLARLANVSGIRTEQEVQR